MPVGKVMRIVLEQRIRTVRRYARRVGERPGDDPEDVHQLRVATRRLSAAIAVFKPLIDKDAARRLNRAARRLRRAAGPARDLDVLRAAIAEFMAPPVGETRPRRLLLKRLDKRRRRAAEELECAMEPARLRFRRAVDRFGRKVTGTGGAPNLRDTRLHDFSDRVMWMRWDNLLAAARGELSHADELHVLRLRAKRLRYALEVFTCCFPTGLAREWYAFVEGIQGQLGLLNDLRNLATLLDDCEQREQFANATDAEAVARLILTLRQQVRREWRSAHRRFLDVWYSAESQSLRDRLAANWNGGGTGVADAAPDPPRSGADIVDTWEQGVVDSGVRRAETS